MSILFRCIGQKERGRRCENEFQPTLSGPVPNPEHPTWPYLCPQCANEPPRKGSTNTCGIVQERPNKGII
jgi:hypothetical protein